jgi:2-iminobutanoate/2-iminopropanoate deaminase
MFDEPSSVEMINCDKITRPAGHYSHAAISGGLVFVSGQLPVCGDGVRGSGGTFDEQAELAIDNLMAVLEAAGCGLRDIIRCTAYIVGIENWPRFNEVYAAKMGDHRPARSVVPVPQLHYGYLVEVEAIATQRTKMTSA